MACLCSAWSQVGGSFVPERQRWLHPHVCHLSWGRLEWQPAESLCPPSLSPSGVVGLLCMASKKAKAETARCLKDWSGAWHRVKCIALSWSEQVTVQRQCKERRTRPHPQWEEWLVHPRRAGPHCPVISSRETSGLYIGWGREVIMLLTWTLSSDHWLKTKHRATAR